MKHDTWGLKQYTGTSPCHVNDLKLNQGTHYIKHVLVVEVRQNRDPYVSIWAGCLSAEIISSNYTSDKWEKSAPSIYEICNVNESTMQTIKCKNEDEDEVKVKNKPFDSWWRISFSIIDPAFFYRNFIGTDIFSCHSARLFIWILTWVQIGHYLGPDYFFAFMVEQVSFLLRFWQPEFCFKK